MIIDLISVSMENEQDCRQEEHKSTISKRRQQRQCIVEFLYMWQVQRDVPVETLLKAYLEEKADEVAEEILQADFIPEAVLGVVNHEEFIDDKIQKFAKNWAFDRIAKVDLAILRLAIYELCFCPNTPVAVVINEALELSKCYSSDDSKRFINGILDHVAKEDLKK